MIDADARNALYCLLQKGDYDTAVRIYEETTGRKISARYMEKFIKGVRKVTGKKPGSHQPLDMYAAFVLAIKERNDRKVTMSQKAIELTSQLQ